MYSPYPYVIINIEINFGKHAKTVTVLVSAVTGSIKLLLYSVLIGNQCVICAPVDKLDM